MITNRYRYTRGLRVAVDVVVPSVVVGRGMLLHWGLEAWLFDCTSYGLVTHRS